MSALNALQIGMTASGSHGGGLDRYFFSLMAALRAQHVRSHALVVGDPGGLPANERDAVECYAPEGVPLIGRLRALRAAVDRRVAQSDLIVSHFAPYTFAIADRARQRPLVVHMHGPWARESAAEGQSPLAAQAKRMIEGVAYRGGARVVVLSRSVATIAEREYGVAADQIRIVPGGVDTRHFRITTDRASARAALGLPADRPIVLAVRRLVRAKGLENLVDAVAALAARFPDVLLVIAGTGPLEGELRRAADECGIGERVRLLGYVGHAQLPALYRAADLLVVPTLALEGFGLVVLESLACGTPAIATPVMGLPEVLAPLGEQLILDGTDSASIARGVADVLDRRIPVPDEAACVDYARGFDWSVIAERVGRVYREVA